eukprot:357056-Chlamydomonas_euryale.AAC.1
MVRRKQAAPERWAEETDGGSERPDGEASRAQQQKQQQEGSRAAVHAGAPHWGAWTAHGSRAGAAHAAHAGMHGSVASQPGMRGAPNVAEAFSGDAAAAAAASAQHPLLQGDAAATADDDPERDGSEEDEDDDDVEWEPGDEVLEGTELPPRLLQRQQQAGRAQPPGSQRMPTLS